jgi:hypothetical protein
MIMIAITQAKIGRFMKKRGIGKLLIPLLYKGQANAPKVQGVQSA